MFIQCSDCDYKYIVNSADLKPDGRMVECANCNHRWFQEPLKGEDLLSSSVPKTSQEKPFEKEEKSGSDVVEQKLWVCGIVIRCYLSRWQLKCHQPE